MKIHAAGGKGEHGRNCFCIDDGQNTFLLDCGIIAEDRENPNPCLSKDEIERLKVIFISHSHADHCGALEWIYAQGFNGAVVATKETFENISFQIPNKIYLEQWNKLQNENRFGIKIEYGRSGHCLGGVSIKLKFTDQKRTVFYTGDYTEHTQIFNCDKIRKQKSDFAIVDCAYGENTFTYKKQCHEIIFHIKKALKNCKPVLLPVPKNGRGIELLYFLTEKLGSKKVQFYADDFLMNHISSISSKTQAKWFSKTLDKIKKNLKLIPSNEVFTNAVIFVSNPQLKDGKAILLSKRILIQNGKIIFTGTVEKDTLAQKLVNTQNARQIIYPVHQTNKGYEKLCAKNEFDQVIKFHTPDDDCQERNFSF